MEFEEENKDHGAMYALMMKSVKDFESEKGAFVPIEVKSFFDFKELICDELPTNCR